MSILKVSIGQIKAARALLGWSQGELSKASGVSEPSIKRLESAQADPKALIGGRDSTIAALYGALESAGIEFLAEGATAHGPGVSIKSGQDD